MKMKKIFKNSFIALVMTSFMATLSIADVKPPLEMSDTMKPSAGKMMLPDPVPLEELTPKALSTLQEDPTEEGQTGAKSLKTDILGILGGGAKLVGSKVLDLVTIDNVLTGVGVVGSAIVGPEFLAITESLKGFNKTLSEIEFVKDTKAKVGKFLRTAVEEGVTKAVTKTYGFISSKVSGWFKKKK